MPRTPVQNDVKSNPFITKSISKTLLTPCRQVGLSRKKKTPNSNSSTLNCLDNSSNLSISSSVDLEPTPITLHFAEDTQEQTPNSRPDLPKKNTRISKRLIEDDDKKQTTKNKIRKITSFEESDEDPTPIDEKECVNHKKNDTLLLKQEKLRVSPRKRVKQLIDDEQSLEAVNLQNLNKKNTFDSKVFPDSVDNILNVEKNKTNSSKKSKKSKVKSRVSPRNSNKKIDSDCANENTDDTISKTKILKVYSNKLRNNKDIDNNSSNYSDYEKQLQKTTSKLNKSAENLSQIETEEIQKPLDDSALKNCDDGLLHNPRKIDRKSKNLKRCLSMKKSSKDEAKSKIILNECTVNLSPLENKYNIEDDLITITEISSSEIKNLEKEIQQKKKLIEELKQAEIYKNKHKIKELQELTARWKTGCIQALNDLLPHLQKNCDLNMEMLLKKLNIPEDKIRLSESEDLV